MFMKETEDAIAVLCPQVVGTVGMLRYFLSLRYDKKKILTCLIF